MHRTPTVAAALLLAALPAAAAVPGLIQYQGKLLDSAGVVVPDQTLAMEFRFYDACSGGTLLLTDTHDSVALSDGIYSVALGGGTITPGSEPDLQTVFRDNDVVCMGITVGADAEMTPRQQLLTVPYALRAGTADTATAGVGAGDDVVWVGTHTFQNDTMLLSDKALVWPHTSGIVPPDADFRLTKFTSQPPGQELHPNGEDDEQFMFCYNCSPGQANRDDATQHMFNFKFEQTYFDGDKELQEHNWNFEGVEGFRWRPFAFRLRVSGECSNDQSLCYLDADCGAGSCELRDQSDFIWTAAPDGICSDDITLTCRVNDDCPTGSCSRDRQLALFPDGTVNVGRQLLVEPRLGGPLGSEYGMRIELEAAPTDNGGAVRAAQVIADFGSMAGDGSSLADLLGIETQATFDAAGAGQAVTSQFSGVQSLMTVDAGGTSGGSITRMAGFRTKSFFSGIGDTTIGESSGLRIASPSVSGTPQVDDHYGLFIEDQQATGSDDNAAIRIDAQSGGDGADGNIAMRGGNATNGHLQLDDGHLWMDPGSGMLRWQQGAPAANGDGRPLHAAPTDGPNWGQTFWGTTASSAHDSGDEVCALAGMTCLEVYDMTSTSASSCATTTHSSARFTVFCY